MKSKNEYIIHRGALLFLTLALSIIVVLEVNRYYHRLKLRMAQSFTMITDHKDLKSENIVSGNIVFIANSSFQWIFPPTDFNYYFFVKQRKVNRLIDTVFNASLLAPKNVQLANFDNRQLFDTHVYWQNEDIRRFLYLKFNVISFNGLKHIDYSDALKQYLKEKNASYVLTDSENMKLFEKSIVIEKFRAEFYQDKCFEYHLLNDIYLIKLK